MNSKALCENRNKTGCPIDCSFWDCKDFKPAQYFLDGLNDQCPCYDDCKDNIMSNVEPMYN
ncbi:hypothetical protein LCGC14_2270340, partial [marine sediment metagenome]